MAGLPRKDSVDQTRWIVVFFVEVEEEVEGRKEMV